MRPLFLQIPLTDAIRMPPYAKYMMARLDVCFESWYWIFG
jgi:hypothetical protein